MSIITIPAGISSQSYFIKKGVFGLPHVKADPRLEHQVVMQLLYCSGKKY